MLERVPGARLAARLLSQVFVELNFPLAAHFYGIVPLADRGEKIGRAFLKKEVQDPAVRDVHFIGECSELLELSVAKPGEERHSPELLP